MNNKIFIGLTPTQNSSQEIDKAKANLTQDSYISNTMYYFPNSYHVFYKDKKHAKQLREEVWEEVEPRTFRIAMIRSVKDNTLEGEQISFIWD